MLTNVNARYQSHFDSNKANIFKLSMMYLQE